MKNESQNKKALKTLRDVRERSLLGIPNFVIAETVTVLAIKVN